MGLMGRGRVEDTGDRRPELVMGGFRAVPGRPFVPVLVPDPWRVLSCDCKLRLEVWIRVHTGNSNGPRPTSTAATHR